MKDRPILFSGAMVRALLAGTKTQTRRIIKNPDYYGCLTGDCPHMEQRLCDAEMQKCCRYGAPGDRLWVKETWCVHRDYNALSPTRVYEAMGGDTKHCVGYIAEPMRGDFWGKTRVSIHMPRWASRLTLEVTEVRCERLQSISAEDALAEGIDHYTPGVTAALRGEDEGNPIEEYRALWERINGAGSWEKNPWVWAITFKRLSA